MRTRSSSAFLLLLAAAIVAPACSVDVEGADPNGPAPAPVPTSLRDAKIPADFAFASTRAIGIQISVNIKNLPQDKEFPVEVWNMRNEMLAAGKPDQNGKVSFEYPLPLGDKQLVIKVGDQQQIVDVDKNNSASVTFECHLDSTASAKPLPCAANTTLTLYVPSVSTHGTLMLEDQWPGYGDLDFNDAVISYQYAFAYKNGGELVELTATFNVLAAGNGRDNGFALALPIPKVNVGSVTLQKGNGSPSALAPRAAETNLVVDILGNTKSAFDAEGNGHQINTDPAEAVLPGTTYQVVIALSTPTALDSTGAPFDAFFYWTNTPSHEIHRPGFAGTASMNAALFNTQQDGSTPARHFVDNRGIPYVLDVPATLTWSKESTDISSGYAQLAAFGQSGGMNNQNWHQSPTNASLFTAGQGGSLPPAASFVGGNGSYTIDGQCDLCATNNVSCPAASGQCKQAGTCTPATGMCSAETNKANGTGCNDGDTNTGGDVCTNGACAGSNLCANVTCPAVGQCQNQGTCPPGTGVCSPATNKANGTVCNDNIPDTSGDVCDNGTCKGVPSSPFVYHMNGPFFVSNAIFQGNFNTFGGFCTQLLGQTAYIVGQVHGGPPNYESDGVWQGNGTEPNPAHNCNNYTTIEPTAKGYGAQGAYGSCTQFRHVVCTTNPNFCNASSADCLYWD